jgi:hypothetical protein
MAGIAEIFRTYGPEYIAKHPNMPLNHRKVLVAILQCRTGQLGQAVYHCQGCGKVHTINCSCGNRHCPLCQYHKSQDWLTKQQNRQLSVPHFMITFTVPQEMRGFLRSHQSFGYQALFQASSQALKLLARDSKFIGTDLPGFTGVLHTWGRQLTYHPHIHYIVPGGGLSPDRTRWLQAQPAFYLPVRALSLVYRAKFKELVTRAGLLQEVDPKAWATPWNVNSKAVGDGDASLTYLAPYVFKVAIGNSRIVKVQNRTVTFSYRKKDSTRSRTMDLDVMEFIRRFLQHALPAGFMKVRHYGFMHPSCSVPIDDIKTLTKHSDRDSRHEEEAQPKILPGPAMYCPDCGRPLVFDLRLEAAAVPDALDSS